MKKKCAPVEISSGRKNIHPPVENFRRQQKEVVLGNFLLRAYVFSIGIIFNLRIFFINIFRDCI